jgi:hypothetical protein
MVPDWVDTYRLPRDLDRSLDSGPTWIVVAGVVAGLALVVGGRFVGVASSVTFFIAWLAAVAAWVLLASARGPAWTDALGTGVFTAAWIWGVGSWALGARSEDPSDQRWLIGVAFLVVGAWRQLAWAARLHRLATRRQAALRSLAEGGTRTDGWIVALARSPIRRGLTLEAADGSGRTWSAEPRAWRSPRPAVGHPVAIWTTAEDVAVVVLTPPVRRA